MNQNGSKKCIVVEKYLVKGVKYLIRLKIYIEIKLYKNGLWPFTPPLFSNSNFIQYLFKTIS